MKGLLNRLADRATGTAQTVRSDARLSFSRGAFGANMEFAETLPRTTVEPFPTAIEQASIPQPSSTRDFPALDSNARAASQPSRDSMKTVRNRDAWDRQQADAETTAPAAAPSFQIGSGIGPVVGVEAPTESSAPAARIKTSDGSLRQMESSRHSPPARAPDLTHFRETAARPVDEPPRLAPMVNPRKAESEGTAPPVSMPRTAIPDPLAQAAPSEQSTEVHIHIGRIEVTAVHDAPPQRRQRDPQSRQPKSLDAYLAERARK